MNTFQRAAQQYVLAANTVASGATSNSASVDTKGLGEVRFTVLVNAVATGNASGVKLQQSVDNSVWTDVPDGAAATAPTTANSGTLWVFHVSVSERGLDRYLRVAYTQGGSGSSVIDILADKFYLNESPSTAAERGALVEVIA